MKLAARAIAAVLATALATIMTLTTAQAAPPVPYTVQVVTCDLVGAGTDARIEARLNGTISSSPWLGLGNPGDYHENGRVDTYNFVAPYLGPIQSVDIAVNPGGDPWCLDEVVVRGPDGVTVHPHHNWVRRAYPKSVPLRLPAA
ncbi:hypothetical protein UK23_15730 [Lentzea aerocolonigenes]|uniref:PLAT domain-containing protein n=1 Tax=Lentzea aerocolonigenes TaxID=68170 RepID=A0A0F0H1Y0_LENAE|nr:PLAT/LH2 domain-containing protein [Lentzea aerocolonigenes]KJK48861.1 hypothetical protein UK23_15730 [Lentzea aerocolonigenes]